MFFEKVLTELQKNKVKYLVIGGVAVNLHGFQRATGDLDIWISLKPKNIDQLLKAIKTLKLKPRVPVKVEDIKDPGQVKRWKKEKNMLALSLYDPKNDIDGLDIVFETGSNFEEAYKHRETVSSGALRISVVSLRGLIGMKSKAGRERDKLDVAALKRVQREKNG